MPLLHRHLYNQQQHSLLGVYGSDGASGGSTDWLKSSRLWKSMCVATCLAIVSGSVATTTSTTWLEAPAAEEAPPAEESSNPDTEPVQEKKEEEEDPYENLPEEDEPTDCSMCNTFRQGPCRPYWRKLERCFKDRENEANGAVNCMRYFSPHQYCLEKYINLYNLVRMSSYQEFVEEMEIPLLADQLRKMKLPPIDWSIWHSFQKDAGPSFHQGIASESPNIPLWKRFPEDTEPVVLTLSAQVPREDKSGRLLRFAYIVDQDGMVLGVESNNVYKSLKDQADGKPEEANATDEEDEENEEAEVNPMLSFDFYVVPCITQKIQVKAVYATNPLELAPEEKGRGEFLCESPLVQLGGVE